jgi:MFS family permease
MRVPVRKAEASVGASASAEWPASGWAWFTLFALVFGTFLNFLDATAFGLVIERIREDYGLSNTQIGWLVGPANVIFYLVVLLPLSRLVDIYPRKYVLARPASPSSPR